MPSWTKYIAKFLTALAGVVAIAISQGLVAGTAAKWLAIVIAVGASVGVWAMPNSLKPVASATPTKTP